MAQLPSGILVMAIKLYVLLSPTLDRFFFQIFLLRTVTLFPFWRHAVVFVE